MDVEDFGQLLVDCRGIDVSTSWASALREIADEPRWLAVVQLGGAEPDAKKAFERHVNGLKAALKAKQKASRLETDKSSGNRSERRERRRERSRERRGERRSRSRRRSRRSEERWQHRC